MSVYHRGVKELPAHNHYPLPKRMLSPSSPLTLPVCLQEPGGGAPQKLCLGLGAKTMSLSRPGETEPIHNVSYGHVAACQLMGPQTLALRVGESQLLLQSPQVSGKREVKNHYGPPIVGTTLGTGKPAMIKDKFLGA